MRTVFLSAVLLALGTSLFAQTTGNVILFSEEGERFFFILNGVQQNAEPRTNVKITGLPEAMYNAKVIFEDQRLGEIKRNMFPVTANEETTFKIRRKKNGEYDINMQSMTELSTAAPAPATQTVVVYHAEPLPPPVTVGVTTPPTTTTTTTTTAPNNANININVPGFNMSATVDGIRTGGTRPATTSTTTTTQTTTTVSGTTQPQATYYQMPGYTGAIGCAYPMDESAFAQASASIGKQNFEQQKLQVAKQVFNTNCMTSAQVKNILGLFDFEQSRLDFAKYAYGRTYDIANYYTVNDVFDFSTSVDELNRYISANPARTVTVVTSPVPPTPPTRTQPVPPAPPTTRTTPQTTTTNVNVNGLGINMTITGDATTTGAIEDNTVDMSGSTTTTTTAATGGVRTSRYTGCGMPMTGASFSSAKASIEKQSFEQQRLQVAKQVFTANCMSSSQVKDILALFSFEQTKLDFAKFAYGRTSDPQNYYIVNDAFSFSTSVDELNKYIGTR